MKDFLQYVFFSMVGTSLSLLLFIFLVSKGII